MNAPRHPFSGHRQTALAGDCGTRFLTLELDRASIDIPARTVPISFSSEQPVERWFGQEILDHAPSAVRLGRLNNGGALLMDHNREDQIGVVESATIGKDKKGRALVRFGKSDRAEEIFQDVLDGIRRLISVGYRIHKTETKNKAGGVEIVRVTDWEPFEISVVSIPADDSVGVGRAAPPAHSLPTLFSNTMDPNTPAAPEAPTAPATRALETPAAPRVEVVREAPPSPPTEDAVTRGITAERLRISTVQAIAAQARSQGLTVDSERAIADGITPDAFRASVFETLTARQAAYTPGNGNSRSEQRDLSTFSVVRAIQCVLGRRSLDGLEGEMHQEAQREAREFGLALRGEISLPTVLLNHGRRDLTAGVASEGGNTVYTQSGSFIELLYAKMVLRDLGAQFLTNLTGNFSLPKLLTGAAPTKKGETAALDESSPTFGQVNFSPKRVGGFEEYSKQLLMQSSVGIEGIVRNDLATKIALAMELGAIYGGGSQEPTGILNTAGIGSVAGGTNGLAPTRSHMVKLRTAVATANADNGSLGYLTNPLARGKMQETQIDPGSGLFVWGDDDAKLCGYKAGVTTQVPSTLTKGSSAGVCSAVVFGNFADLIIAQWGGIDIQVNPYIKDTEGLVRITADAYYDAGIRRAASFAAMLDALTI